MPERIISISLCVGQSLSSTTVQFQETLVMSLWGPEQRHRTIKAFEPVDKVFKKPSTPSLAVSTPSASQAGSPQSTTFTPTRTTPASSQPTSTQTTPERPALIEPSHSIRKESGLLSPPENSIHPVTHTFASVQTKQSELAAPDKVPQPSDTSRVSNTPEHQATALSLLRKLSHLVQKPHIVASRIRKSQKRRDASFQRVSELIGVLRSLESGRYTRDSLLIKRTISGAEYQQLLDRVAEKPNLQAYFTQKLR